MPSSRTISTSSILHLLNKSFKYYQLIWLLGMVIMSSCSRDLNKTVTLWKHDKIPYGTYYAFNSLDYIFSNSTIESSDRSPETFYEMKYSSAYLVVGHSVRPSDNELNGILNHAITGNHVFISALDIGSNLLDSFKLKTSSSGSGYFRDSLDISIEDPSTGNAPSFSYPGLSLDKHFTSMDSSVTNIMGRNKNGQVNFVKFTYKGGGTVMIHLAPGAFTNFFLLHKNNKRYYDIAMSSIPDTVNAVLWDDYYRHHYDGNDTRNRSAFSKLGTFLKHDVLRWAFWLTIVLFGVIYLFESKRKQRFIPAIKKMDNASLSFVKTVGRLYYQRKDNKNLAQKIITHFLTHVRTRYNMQTSSLNEEFARKLSFKSGYPPSLVSDVIAEIKKIEDAYEVSDDQLMAFNDKIDTFINKA